MNTNDHTLWTDRLSELLDGGLDEEARQAVERHLADCGACRDLLADLREVRDAARALEPTDPAKDLWPGVAAAIGAPRPGPTEVIELPTARRREPARRGIFLTLPQMAAASVALVATSAALAWWAGPGSGTPDLATPAAVREMPVSLVADVAAPPADLAGELEALESVLAEASGRLDPATVRILEKNLQVIERAIEDSRQALAIDPGNTFLRDHLAAAYREKVDYLREARDLVEWIS